MNGILSPGYRRLPDAEDILALDLAALRPVSGGFAGSPLTVPVLPVESPLMVVYHQSQRVANPAYHRLPIERLRRAKAHRG